MIARSILAGVVVLGLAFASWGQTTPPAVKPASQPATQSVPAALKDSLARFVPADTVFFIERAGHDAVQNAFDESNLGEAFREPEVTDFLYQFLRARAYEILANVVFDIDDVRENDDSRATLDHLLATIWYKPTAFFMLSTPPPPPDEPWRWSRHYGMICTLPQAERKDVRPALESLMQNNIGGDDDSRQPFIWTTEKLTWNGVAYRCGTVEELPTEVGALEKALDESQLLMVCWTDKHVLVATSLAVADALDKRLADESRPALATDVNFQTVMTKAHTDNGAFRWYVNIQAAGREIDEDEGDGDDDEPSTDQRMWKALGLANVKALGGTMGFEKKTVTYRMFVLSPETDKGLLRLFAQGGSYKPALAMIPRDSVLAAAGQTDARAIGAMIRLVAQEQAEDYQDRQRMRREMWETVEDIAAGGDGSGVVKQTEEEIEAEKAKLSDDVAAALKNIEDIAAGSSGHAGAFIGPISLETLMEENAPPVGFVLGMKNEKAALDALASMRELIVNMDRDRPRRDADDEDKPQLKAHRGVMIHPLGRRTYAAALDDRLILSPSPKAVRQAIDAAKAPETHGGFAAKSKGEAYATLAGDGAGVLFVDFGGLVKSFWPQLQMGAEHALDDGEENWSLPDLDTLLKHLGPEIAVIANDPDGLRITSTGLVPFSSYLVSYGGLALMFIIGHGW